jgi:hypothetical protein
LLNEFTNSVVLPVRTAAQAELVIKAATLIELRWKSSSKLLGLFLRVRWLTASLRCDVTTCPELEEEKTRLGADIGLGSGTRRIVGSPGLVTELIVSMQ